MIRQLVQEYVPGVGPQQGNMIVDKKKKCGFQNILYINVKHFTLRRKEIPI
jgi:hypothetical protein